MITFTDRHSPTAPASTPRTSWSSSCPWENSPISPVTMLSPTLHLWWGICPLKSTQLLGLLLPVRTTSSGMPMSLRLPISLSVQSISQAIKHCFLGAMGIHSLFFELGSGSTVHLSLMISGSSTTITTTPSFVLTTGSLDTILPKDPLWFWTTTL